MMRKKILIWEVYLIWRFNTYQVKISCNSFYYHNNKFYVFITLTTGYSYEDVKIIKNICFY